MKVQTLHPQIEMIQIGDARSSYLIRDDLLALVETPHPHEASELISGLAQLGIKPRDLKCLITTHIHLDHAGATGHLVRENPDLIVFVHEIGAPHLINPERLNRSAQRSYGDRIAQIGEMLPTPETQVHPVTDGDTISLGTTQWKVIHTPGHARYHICLFEPSKKVLFTGDALGCLYPETPLFIVVPAPEYDYECALQSIYRLEALKPELIIFTHLGPSRDKTLFSQARQQHQCWLKSLEKLFKAYPNAPNEEILSLASEAIPIIRKYPQYLPSYLLNVGGIRHYLKKRLPSISQ